MATHQDNDVKCSHNPNSNKKHVKFSKTLTSTTVKKSSSKKWRTTSKVVAPTHPQTQQMPATNTVKMGKSAVAATPTSTDGTYYYYYYYNTETHQAPAINDEQQQQQVYNNNIAGNYYYYTIDGTSDANYNEFIMQPAGNTENYNWR